MIEQITIKNFKSIVDETIELSNVNVFIGENGCGKTNILEAVAMLSAAKDHNLNNIGLFNKGIRVTKPSLTMSSFIGQKQKKGIEIYTKFISSNNLEKYYFNPIDFDNINSEWKFISENNLLETLVSILNKNLGEDIDINIKKSIINSISKNKEEIDDEIYNKTLLTVNDKIIFLSKYLIFNLNTQALRGINNTSKEIPLGINGEGLDVLLNDFSNEESAELKEFSYLISWLDDFFIDEKDNQKYKNLFIIF